MNINIDFPFEGYTKGDLIEFCFGKNADVDTAIPLEFNKLLYQVTGSRNNWWYVMDYTENKPFGKLVNLKEKFFGRIAALYLQQLPKTMAHSIASKQKCFRFNLSHDNGVQRILVIATSEEAAKTMIMDAEGCPESALEKIRA